MSRFLEGLGDFRCKPNALVWLLIADMIHLQTCRTGADVALVADTNMLSRDTKVVEPVQLLLVSARASKDDTSWPTH